MLGTQVSADRARFLGFIVEAIVFAGKRERVSLNVGFFFLGEAGDNRRINSAAKEYSQRNITHKLALNGSGQLLSNARLHLVVGRTFDFADRRNVPKAFRRKRKVREL